MNNEKVTSNQGDIIYLTGAAGFVGQMLIRQCESDDLVSKVYCPVRDKKELSGIERFDSLLNRFTKCVFLKPENPLPSDVTLVLLNAYNIRFFTPVEVLLSESVKPMVDILDQAAHQKSQGNHIREIAVVLTAYVQPPLPFKQRPDNAVLFLLEG